MRFLKEFVIVTSVLWLAVAFGCGGGGGSDTGSSGTGTISMSMTDAKPMLPETSGKTITNVFVTIDDVLVHSSGGGWVSLASKMVENPYTIDLLQFTDGVTTEFVPPVPLETGKYTQIRLSVQRAWLRFNTNDEVEITVPSENLKTDKNFEFEVPEAKNNGDGNPADPAAVDITIDFDLSKSLVLEGSEYKLKPVLHIVETADAATIEGFIDNSLFPLDGLGYVEITVFDRTDQQQEYTTIKVVKDDNATDEMTAYSVFWLVPNQSYTVKINYNPGLDDDPNTAGIQDGYDKSVTVPDPSDLDYPEDTLPPGDIYRLDFSPPPTT